MFNGQPTILQLTTKSGTYRAIAEIYDELGVAAKFNQIVGEVFFDRNPVNGIRITVDLEKDRPAVAQIHIPEANRESILDFETEIMDQFAMTSVKFHSIAYQASKVSPRNSPYFPREYGLRWLNGEFNTQSSVHVYTERIGVYRLQELQSLPRYVPTPEGDIDTHTLCKNTRGVHSLDPFTNYPLSLESRMGRLSAENGASIRDQLAQLVSPIKSALFEPRWTIGQVLTFDHMDQMSLHEDVRFQKYLRELRVLCKVFGYSDPRIDVLSDSPHD